MDYNEFADIYDLTCPGVEGDVQFYLKQATQSGGNILEVGCGTGRIYLALRKARIAITGIDNSSAMLSLLEKKAREDTLEIDVRLQSVTNLEAKDSYSLILLPYRVFMHLYSKEDQVKALIKLREAITAEGEIIIDLFNPDVARIAAGSSYFLLTQSKEHVVWLWEEFNTETQVVDNIFRVESLNSEGRVVDTVLKSFSARWFFQEEFASLVMEAGLKVKAILADYDGKIFTGSEDKMIWVLGK